MRDGVGTVFMRLDVPTLAILQALLDPLARPRPTGPDGPDLRSSERRQADAFAEFLGVAQAAVDAPNRGSIRPRLTLTMSYDGLVNKVGYATLNSVLTDSGPTHLKVKAQAGACGSCGAGDRARNAIDGDGSRGGPGRQTLIGYRITGPPLSATLVRQLACDAEIIPVVLGGDGAVLDLGRGTRLFTYAQRHALAERDGYYCHFPHCRRPEKWTEAHHINHWADGGATDLNNGVLLCQHHHTVIHTQGWTVRMGPDGHP
ncbi:HNH endonuclease, partial [Actinopolymorpha pittospori]